MLSTANILIAQIPAVSSGTIKHFEKFASKYVPDRNVDVWLPDGYNANKKYAVLYMHDGRALFDASIMWNKQAWHVDEVLGKLMAEKKIKDCIVVGIWNGDDRRHSEYFPQKPFEALSMQQQDELYKTIRNGSKLFSEKIQSDNYLKFVVTELKPFIDSHFSTLSDQKNTFIAGSSMGGLISMYAICEYPQIFGGAACLSTHWTGVFTAENNPIPTVFLSYLHKHIPSPKNHKLYFDHGTQTLDTLYAQYQIKADAIIRAKGYTSTNFETKVFEGADHTETSWNKRLAIPVTFLLGTSK
jgi:enterochelin esterase-like enzyme